MRHGLRYTLVVAILLSLVTAAWAGQTVEIRLKDGSRWKGEVSQHVQLTIMEQGVKRNLTGRIIKASGHYITLETDIAGETREKTIFNSDIVKIKTIDAAPTASASAKVKRTRRGPTSRSSSPRPPSSSEARSPDQPGVFVLPLKGVVGLHLRHEEMEMIAEEADRYGPGQIIVFEIDSPGGSLFEMEKIHESMLDIKKRHRLVAWIKKAISGGCATAILCNEIYFTTEGTAGAMTAFNVSTGQAWSGEEMHKWMNRAGDWMEEGGRDRAIAETMIHAPLELSYDTDPETGDVTFYNDLSGDHVLSRDGENLVFTASSAVHCGFADGVADNYEELAELLDLPDWYEISDYGREIHQEWFDTVERAQDQVQRLMQRLSYAASGSGDPVKIMGKRIQIMEDLIAWHDRAPNAMMMMPVLPKEQLQREVKELRKQLADLKRR